MLTLIQFLLGLLLLSKDANGQFFDFVSTNCTSESNLTQLDICTELNSKFNFIADGTALDSSLILNSKWIQISSKESNYPQMTY